MMDLNAAAVIAKSKPPEEFGNVASVDVLLFQPVDHVRLLLTDNAATQLVYYSFYLLSC